MSAPARDTAARYLDLLLRALPTARRQWGSAMRAELESIDSPAERRRFALSCTRVALLPGIMTPAGRRSAATAGAAGIGLVAALALAGLIGPTLPALVLLTALGRLGRRPGAFGPVRPERSARVVRATGYALVGSLLALEAVGDGASTLLHPVKGGPMLTLLLGAMAAAFLAMTARGSRFGGPGLTSGAAAGVIAGAAAFAALPFERIGTPLADGLPAHGSWLALVAFGALVAAALVTAVRTRRSDQAVMAVLCAGSIAALLVALLGLGAIELFPHSVPDIVGPVMPPGTSAAARQAENVIEASDPYDGLWVFGALLAAVLWVAARPPGRVGASAGLLFLFGLPPILLGASAHDFPGASLITLTTIAAVVGAIVTTRPGTPARADPPEASCR